MNRHFVWRCLHLVWLTVGNPGATFGNECDLATAQRLHAEARSVGSSERLDRLRQAWQACPDPRIGYDLGLALLATGAFDDALAQLRATRERVPAASEISQRLRPAIEARIAETELARGAIGQAEAAIGRAEVMPGGSDHPVVLAVRRAIDDAPERQLMTADQIAVALSAQRAVGISERIALFILFDMDQDRPTAVGDRQVTELGQVLQPLVEKGRRVLLIGHTDSQGDADYNLALSQRRAESVKTLLEQRQPALRGRLEARGRGETQPRYRGDSAEDRRLNRRVEVVLLEGS